MIRTVVFLVPSHTDMLDLTGPLDVFTHANTVAGVTCYRTVVVGIEETLTLLGGLEIKVGATLSDLPLEPIDTVVVLGSIPLGDSAEDDLIAAWLRANAGSVRRVVSVCVGAFVLAAAGILDGRRATTHWSRAETLGEAYPSIDVDPDAIFVQDGGVWTSAGVSAGIDMALALVEEDLGHRVALAIAQGLVLFLRRSGRQSQFSIQLDVTQSLRPGLRDVATWIAGHLTEDLSVPVLASRAGMSRRNFTRMFTREVGTSPASFVEDARLIAARRLLETTRLSLDEIAVQCGMERAANLRRVFLRRLGISGREYRARFAQRAVASDRPGEFA